MDITKAIKEHGASAVHVAAAQAMQGRKKNLESMVGRSVNLRDAYQAMTAAYNAMTDYEKAAVYTQASIELAGL